MSRRVSPMTELILYTAVGNATERVQWALNYKGIPYRQLEVESLAAGEYARINPFGYVPTLQIGEQLLAESLAMIEYLEEMRPTPTLFPGTALERAKIREISEFVNSTVHPVQNRSVLAYLRPELDAAGMRQLRADWLRHNLARLAPRLWRQGDYAVGEQFSLADILVAVIYKRALSQGVAAAEFPAFGNWMRFLFSQDQIRAAAPFQWE